MSHQTTKRLLWPAVLMTVAASTAQAQRSETEARLRDLLRQTTTELRDLQSQNAELRAKVDELKAQGAAAAPAPKPAPNVDSAALRRAQQEAADLRRELADLRQERDQRDKALEKWKQSADQAGQLARAHEADAKQLNQQQQALAERYEICQRDNGELVSIARELLDRYQRKGIWASLRDAEPITGIHRVKLETLAQQYHAKIIDLKSPPADAPLPSTQSAQ